MKAEEHAEKILSDLVVTKANDLIQAGYKLSLYEQRLLLCCIAQVDSRKSTGAQRNNFRVSIADFVEAFPDAAGGGVYGYIKDAVTNLFEREIKLSSGKKKTRIRWVQSVTYHDGEGYVELHFSDKIAPYLTLIGKRFTSYQLKQVSALRSTYAIRLFEMLMQWKETGLLLIDLDKFIEQLELPYERFVDVRRRVIEPAIAELVAKSNLEIEWKPIKQGKPVKRIEFKFREAKQAKLDI